MKPFKPIHFLTAVCLACVIFSGCRKDEKGCAIVPATSVAATSMAIPAVALQLVDSQNRDLFDTATPNHYDSLTVMQLNNNKLNIFKYPGKHLLIIYYPSGEHSTIFSLSTTDQDTVYTNTQTIYNKCSSYQKLIAFKYNGKSYTDTLSTGRFVIVK